MTRVLDVTGFTVHTILGIDLKTGTAIAVFYDFIHPGRAVALCGLIVEGQVVADGNICILQLEVAGLCFLVVGVGKKDRGQLVKTQLVVRFWINDFLGIASRNHFAVIWHWIGEGPG